MTKYRVFLVSQILFIGSSLAVPTNVEEATTLIAETAASTSDSSAVPSSSVLPDGVSESTIAAAAEILQRASEVKEAISIGNGTILTEDGDGIPDDGWEYENTTYVDTRRILYSKTVEKGKRPYMVYLQLTKESAKAHKYRGWLCGGVIVDKYYVLTSAACVEDADRFYIVSGTTKFVDSFDFKNNDCVCKHRRRVVWKCIPKNYKFDFQDSIKWSSNDIAIVKVDRPFKLGVTEQGCEFAPDLVCINNVSRELEKPGTKGFIAGWGSGSNFREGVYRRQKVHIPQNAKCLQEAKVCIMDNEQCAKRWAQRFRNIITQYMICTKDVMKRLSELCEKKYANCTDVDIGKSRRSAEQFEEPNNEVSSIWNVDLGRHLRDPDDYTARRASNHGGFCENDHGGPLIVRYQNKERVIGVISACKIDPKSHNCHGPFLYTSVFRNRQFISCAINKDVQENCRRVFRTGITHEEWQVSWDGYKEEDEIDMKADSKKDENEFNSDEIEDAKPYLRQNDEDVLEQIIEDPEAGKVKSDDDSSSGEIKINNKKKLVNTKEVKKANEEENEEIVKKSLKNKEADGESQKEKEETVKKPLKNKETDEESEEEEEETVKKPLKNKEDDVENEEVEEETLKKPIKIKINKEKHEEEEEYTDSKPIKPKYVKERKEDTEEETKKKPVKSKGAKRETEEDDYSTETKPVKIKEVKEHEDETEETEKTPIKTKEAREQNAAEEEKEEIKPQKTKNERKRKHKKNKKKSKRKVKKVKKSEEVDSETEDEADVKMEVKEQPITEAVMEEIEKAVVEDKIKGTAVILGGDPDKAEMFYESSRDENVNDPLEEK